MRTRKSISIRLLRRPDRPFRLDILRYLAPDDGAGIGSGIRAYVRELEGYLAQLRAAGVAGDCPGLRRTAHRLSSHFAVLEHAGLFACAQRIEASAATCNLDDLRTQLAELTAGVRKFKRQLLPAGTRARRR